MEQNVAKLDLIKIKTLCFEDTVRMKKNGHRLGENICKTHI